MNKIQRGLIINEENSKILKTNDFQLHVRQAEKMLNVQVQKSEESPQSYMQNATRSYNQRENSKILKKRDCPASCSTS